VSTEVNLQLFKTARNRTEQSLLAKKVNNKIKQIYILYPLEKFLKCHLKFSFVFVFGNSALSVCGAPRRKCWSVKEPTRTQVTTTAPRIHLGPTIIEKLPRMLAGLLSSFLNLQKKNTFST